MAAIMEAHIPTMAATIVTQDTIAATTGTRDTTGAIMVGHRSGTVAKETDLCGIAASDQKLEANPAL
jgi:hypothetical protein